MKRRKITVTGSGEAARACALLLAQRDDAELVLLAEDHLGLHAAAVALGFEPRATGPASWSEAAGSELVVVFADDHDGTLAGGLARCCPDAVLVLATPDPAATGAALQDVLRWPRARVLGVAPGFVAAGPLGLAAGAAQLVDAVVADRGHHFDAVVEHHGEGGREGWACGAVRVDGRGVAGFD